MYLIRVGLAHSLMQKVLFQNSLLPSVKIGLRFGVSSVSKWGFQPQRLEEDWRHGRGLVQWETVFLLAF